MIAGCLRIQKFYHQALSRHVAAGAVDHVSNEQTQEIEDVQS